MAAYETSAHDVQFSESREAFEAVAGFLGSREAMLLSHADLEKEVVTRGREVLRRLVQDHLRLRAMREAAEPMTGADGTVRTHLRSRTRPLMTVFGRVEVERIAVGTRGEESLFPLDAELNLPVEEHSHGVRERVANEAARGSFEDAVEAVTSSTGATVSKLQAERLVRLAANDFDAYYAARPQAEIRAIAGEIVALSTDGKGVVVRKEDLREQTRREAEKKPDSKLSKRLTKGEKRNRKRMATVAAVYTIQPFVRTPDDVVRELRPVEDATSRAARPKPRQKRVWASVKKDPREIIGEMFAEATRRDPERRHTWAVLVDGQQHQLTLVHDAAKQHGVEPIVVLDLIHALEYLWKASYCFHPEGTKEAEAWVTERLRALLEGKSSDVAAGIRRSATLRGLGEKEREAADKCADYFLKNKEYMRYDEYLAKGLPIATGVIEGACRHLVKDRMDLTGARWSLDGADAVLRLRALRSSGDFAAYWPFHLAQELARNHLSRYAPGSRRIVALSRTGS